MLHLFDSRNAGRWPLPGAADTLARITSVVESEGRGRPGIWTTCYAPPGLVAYEVVVLHLYDLRSPRPFDARHR